MVPPDRREVALSGDAERMLALRVEATARVFDHLARETVASIAKRRERLLWFSEQSKDATDPRLASLSQALAFYCQLGVGLHRREQPVACEGKTKAPRTNGSGRTVKVAIDDARGPLPGKQAQTGGS